MRPNVNQRYSGKEPNERVYWNERRQPQQSEQRGKLYHLFCALINFTLVVVKLRLASISGISACSRSLIFFPLKVFSLNLRMLSHFHYFITGFESCFFGNASSQAHRWCKILRFSQNCWGRGIGCVVPPKGSPRCECSSHIPNGQTVCIMEEGELYLISIHKQKKLKYCHVGISRQLYATYSYSLFNPFQKLFFVHWKCSDASVFAVYGLGVLNIDKVFNVHLTIFCLFCILRILWNHVRASCFQGILPHKKESWANISWQNLSKNMKGMAINRKV